jgi:hypothetical protein
VTVSRERRHDVRGAGDLHIGRYFKKQIGGFDLVLVGFVIFLRVAMVPLAFVFGSLPSPSKFARFFSAGSAAAGRRTIMFAALRTASRTASWFNFNIGRSVCTLWGGR